MTHGEFAVDPDARTIEGILVPFGEMSRTSVSGAPPAMFGLGDVTIPADPAVVTLNRRHDRFDPVGRAVMIENRPAGVYAKFSVARTTEGDAYLNGQRGTLRKLSAEIAHLVVDATHRARGVLTGAALVDEGAFAGAALFAIETAETHDDTYTDADGVTWRRVETSASVTADDGTTTTTTTTTTGTVPAGENPDDAAGADDTTDPADPADPEKEHALMGKPTIIPAGTTTPRPTAGPSLHGLFSALVRRDETLNAYADAGALFALDTVPNSGPDTETIGQDTAQPAYLGELWGRRSYTRRYVPLLASAPLTAYTMIGWRWIDGKTPEVADYAGNTAEVPSNPVDTEPVTVNAARLAGGNRIDRRFSDFGDTSVVESYMVHQTDSYARKTDSKALAAVIASATAGAAGPLVGNTAPGLAAVVDGALAVIDAENTPSYALVSPELWRGILLTPHDDVLAYLSAAFGVEEGAALGFTIRPANVGAGHVIVGAREALTFYELGGGAPIRVQGVQPGNGATDAAVFGYYATCTNNAKAIVNITAATV